MRARLRLSIFDMTLGGALPDRGVRGNSHMLMMDLNNLQLADMMLEWLATHASRP